MEWEDELAIGLAELIDQTLEDVVPAPLTPLPDSPDLGPQPPDPPLPDLLQLVPLPDPPAPPPPPIANGGDAVRQLRRGFCWGVFEII